MLSGQLVYDAGAGPQGPAPYIRRSEIARYLIQVSYTPETLWRLARDERGDGITLEPALDVGELGIEEAPFQPRGVESVDGRTEHGAGILAEHLSQEGIIEPQMIEFVGH